MVGIVTHGHPVELLPPSDSPVLGTHEVVVLQVIRYEQGAITGFRINDSSDSYQQQNPFFTYDKESGRIVSYEISVFAGRDLHIPVENIRRSWENVYHVIWDGREWQKVSAPMYVYDRG
jgi:hypothetical protein